MEIVKAKAFTSQIKNRYNFFRYNNIVTNKLYLADTIKENDVIVYRLAAE